MRKIHLTAPFRRDLKKIKRSKELNPDELDAAVALLAGDSPLPEHYCDHPLVGEWRRIKARDCHIAPDILLIYAKPPGELRLLRLGSHSELFK
jgi:addiction module toxin, RelE/StbE family